MRKRQVSHEETTIEMLRRDPALADEYLRVSMEEIAEPGGEGAFLAALRQVALARCSTLAEVAPLPA
jgi:DNA-binding phage protein